jgi:predicted N-acyltransferase
MEFSFARSMSDIDRGEWDALASAPAPGRGPPRGWPLLSWGFLALLEESGSICPATGWTPAHVLARRDGELVACAPFYVKEHSWGEFVFDFEIATAAKRMGSNWYPKLVGMVPATPAPAWRVLVTPGEDEAAMTAMVLDVAVSAARQADLGGVHILWPDESAASLLRGRRDARHPWTEWEHQAFLWENRDYPDFEGYLAAFSKNMRRNVRRERGAVEAAGVETRMIGAEEAASRLGLLAAMADMYESHNDKFGPWAAKFLARDFFLRLPEFMPEGWTIAAAFDRGGAAPLALAFLLEGADRLYGRYWGAMRDIDGLHFELCYYLPIEYAISKGIGSFDPGMGSPHKARRGFRSYLAPSFHLAFDRRMASLLERALPGANAAEAEEAAALNEELPFKREPGR